MPQLHCNKWYDFERFVPCDINYSGKRRNGNVSGFLSSKGLPRNQAHANTNDSNASLYRMSLLYLNWQIMICSNTQPSLSLFPLLTSKPCYRKDDRAMRPIYGCPEKFRESSQTPLATFPEICKRHLFRSILRMCIQNLKFVALSVPEIIGGTQKIWAVPVYAHARFSQIFKGLLLVWTLWIYLPTLKFVALPIPEIIGRTSKIWGVPGFAHALYSPKFLKGFCSYGPSEYICQLWSS